MQLEIIPRRDERSVRFAVLRDGVEVQRFGTFALAEALLEKLWNARPESDKVLEALYVGRD